MSLRIFTPPFLPPGAPPLPSLDVNTHAGVHSALATSNSSGGLNGAHRSIVVLSLHHRCWGTCNNSHINSNKHIFFYFYQCRPIAYYVSWLLYVLLPGVWPRNGRMTTAATVVDFFNCILPKFNLAFLSRHTQHDSAKPKSNHKPTTYPTKYLHQYLADEDILSIHPLHMYGGQTPVLYGVTYSLSWGWQFMVNGKKTKKN